MDWLDNRLHDSTRNKRAAVDCTLPALLVAAVMVVVSAAAQARPLAEELAFMLQSSPRLHAASRALRAAREEIGVARSAFMPRVTAAGDLGPESIDPPRGASTDLPRRNAKLTVTQNLFSGFRNSASFAVATIDEQLADLDFRSTTQSVLFDACSAYLEVLRQADLVRLATENREIIREQMGLEDERVSRGSGIAVDVLLAKARLQLAGERVVAFEGALKNAEARYVQVFGRPPLPDRMIRPETLSDLVPERLTDAIEAARGENVNLVSAARRVDRATEQRRMVVADWWPRIDLVGTANYEEDFNARRGIRRDYAILLSMSWDLFSGFRTRYAVSAARARRQQALRTAEDTRRRVEEDVTRAFETLHTALRRVDMLKNATAIAEEVFEARVKLRRAGNETAINVLDARSETFNARINLVSADFGAEIAAVHLLATMGRLTPESLGLEVPRTLRDPAE